MIWLQTNWPTIVSISGALWTFLSVINGLIKDPTAKSMIGKAIDGLSFLSRASAPGTVKSPLSLSLPIAERPAPAGNCDSCGAPLPVPVPAAPISGLWLVFLLAPMLSACTLAQAITNSYKGLGIAEKTVSVALVRFPLASRNHRLELVAKATTEAEGKAALDAWDVTEARISKAVLGTDATVKMCRDALAEISKGVRDKAQLAGWIATGIRLGFDLKDLLAAAGVPLGSF